MATLTQHTSGTYRVRFRFAGRQYFRSLATKNEKAAQTRLAQIDETIGLLSSGRLTIPTGVDPGEWIVTGGRGRPQPSTAPKMADAIDQYFTAIPRGAKAASSLATERTHLSHIARILGGRVDQIDAARMQEYVNTRAREPGIRGRTVQPETLRKELTTFGTFWRWCRSRGWVDGELGIRDCKLPRAREKPAFQTWREIESQLDGLTEIEQHDLWDCLYLREAEIHDLLAHVGTGWLHVGLAIAAYTGARRSEILRSERRDFDFSRAVLMIREKKRQHRQSLSYRRVDIHPRLARIVRRWFAETGGRYTVSETGDKLRPDDAQRAFGKAVRGSKWEVLRGWHILRHSFASICAQQGVRESTISAWLGHQTDEMARRYRHLYPETTRAEMARLFAG